VSNRCVRCGGITGPGLIAGMTSHPRGFNKCDCNQTHHSGNYSKRTRNYADGLTFGMRAMTNSEKNLYRTGRTIRSRKSIYRDVYFFAGLMSVLFIGLIVVCVRIFIF